MSNIQTSLAEYQAAAWTALENNVALMAIITGIFDVSDVPVNQPFPYITIGDTTETPWNAFGRRGYASTLTLHIWDNSTGFKLCQTILAQMNKSLDQQILTLATHTHVSTLYQFSQSMNDPDIKDVRHVPVRYSVLTQEPSSSTTGTYYANVLQDNPIFYARCNETSGLIAHDASGNQAGSISATGVAYLATGALARDTDHSFKLDGSAGYVTAPTGITLAPAFSIEMWVRPFAIPIGGSPRICANSHTDADNKGFQLELNTAGNGGAFYVGNGANSQNTFFSAPFSATLWSHVVATFDSLNMYVYVNGVQVGNAAYSATMAASTFPIAFGKNPAYNGDFFNGYIDECAMYQTALSSARILAHYQSGS
jgi:Concanavalin A-like lectin/glucanases superfamily/Protein of unknown function (DUF3168)